MQLSFWGALDLSQLTRTEARWRLAYELVLDLAARALSKDRAVLPGMRIDPLGCGFSAEVAGELYLET